MSCAANGNRYEGEFHCGLKHGQGCYFHLDSGKLQQGVWDEDTCVASTLRDLQDLPGQQQNVQDLQRPTEQEDLQDQQQPPEKQNVQDLQRPPEQEDLQDLQQPPEQQDVQNRKAQDSQISQDSQQGLHPVRPSLHRQSSASVSVQSSRTSSIPPVSKRQVASFFIQSISLTSAMFLFRYNIAFFCIVPQNELLDPDGVAEESQRGALQRARSKSGRLSATMENLSQGPP